MENPDPAKKPIDYRTPSAKPPQEVGDLGKPQVAFDTIAGPNFRLRDNLIQLVACLVFALIGAIAGYIINHDDYLGLIIGSIAGFVVGGILSGIAIGIFRFIKGVKSR